MGRDFNVVQDGRLHRLPAEGGPGTKKIKILNNTISELGLVDPW